MKEQKMVENAKEMGSYLFDRLQELRKYKYVGDVRGGKGLLATVEIVKEHQDHPNLLILTLG